MAAAAVEAATIQVSAETNQEALSAYSYLQTRLSHTAAKPSGDFTIPIIDISSTFSGSLADRQAVAAKIRHACTTSGFFYITAHGIPQEALDATVTLAERFFKGLSNEQKEKLHMRQSPLHRGWEPPDFTSVHGDAETKQGFNWGYETGLDPTGGDGKYVELDGEVPVNANLWPAEEDLPGFYEGIKSYYGQVLQLARHMCRLFALSLELPENYFDPMITHPGGIARLIHYPPAKAALDAEEEIGLGAHSDYECFTILLCSGTPGLEILSPNNAWVAAPVVKGGLIVNVADFLMRWTNGLYRSTVHRVVNRSPTEERYSIPFFFSINYDYMVDVSPSLCYWHHVPWARLDLFAELTNETQTLPNCITPENPKKYGPVKAGEYILERLNMVRSGEATY